MKKLDGYKENDDLSQWVSFIKADSREVLEKMAKVNPNIDKAVNVLTTMSQDKKARAEYLSREMALHDEATKIEEAMEEGYEQGKEEGREEGIAEGRAEERAESQSVIFKLQEQIEMLNQTVSELKKKLSKLEEA